MKAENDYRVELDEGVASWLAEKSEHILRSLVVLHEVLQERKHVPEGFTEYFASKLSGAVFNATKILSFATNGQWSPTDGDLILEQGTAGLEEVLVKYGLLYETTQAREAREEARRKAEFASLVQQLDQLLSEPQASPSRTLIHRLLPRLSMQVPDPIIDSISDLTERLTFSQMPWNEYVDCVRNLVGELRAKYCLDGG